MTTAAALTATAREYVTVEQAAELNELFLAWHQFHSPDASEVDRRRALRAADLASTRVHQYEGFKLIFAYRATGKRP